MSVPWFASPSRRTRRAMKKLHSKARPALRVEALEDRTTPADVSWVGGVNFDWNTAANWSGNAVPGAADRVVIDLGANDFTVTVPNLSFSVESVTSQAGLNILGSLTVAADSLFTGPLSITGTLAGNGNIVSSGATVLGGVISGPAESSIEFQGPVSISNLHIQERTVTFADGTARWMSPG